MFGHDNHDDNDDNAKGAPMPPDPIADIDTPVSSPSTDTPAPDPATPTPDDSVVTPAIDSDAPSVESGNEDLLDIKQQALLQLTPLVGQLDQTPEEKFRTTMMMIQGADNQGLIKDAYSAAQQISDEKGRAQALLDIVNEINYFTQHKDA
jgi:hypothetical protein